MEENLTRHADSRIPGNGVILSGFKSTPNPRQNEHPISDGFLTNHRSTTHDHASPTESRDAPMPTESTIDAGGTIGQPDGGSVRRLVNGSFFFVFMGIGAFVVLHGDE